MNYWLDIRLKIRDFFRRHKKKIFIIIVIWGVIIAVNYYLKSLENNKVQKPITTYEPHTAVMDETGSVPERYKEPINVLIDSFVNYCNNKDYENAYNLLNSEYKSKYYSSLDEFKKYVDSKFKTKKIYNIQNYSNVNNAYVYNVRILDDILASGTTDGFKFDEEKYVLKIENGSLKLSLDGYIGEEQVGIQTEDEYFKIRINKKDIFYDKVRYNMEIINKTAYYIVLQDGTEDDEIQLQLQNEKRDLYALPNSNIVILPNATVQRNMSFEEFADENEKDVALLFNDIRVLPKFSGSKSKSASEKANAIKLYSLNINLQSK